MIGTSKTYHLLMRLLKALPVRRRRSLLKLIPVAALTGLVDVIVVGIVSRLFTVFIGQPNQPTLPFQNFIPEDPKTKVISLVVIHSNELASIIFEIISESSARKTSSSSLEGLIRTSSEKIIISVI